MNSPVLPVFRREGPLFVPTDAAPGPWSPDALHGGPTCGLLARGLEREVDDPSMLPARLSVDLFRAVPKAPLQVRTRRVRDGRRIKVVDASILHEDTEVARASGLFLLRTDDSINEPWPRKMPGPDGIETTSLGGRRAQSASRPKGFHTTIETRWATERGQGPQAAWFRMPGDLVEGETTSPFARAAAVGDFANAVASFSMPRREGTRGPIFINTDTTLYMSREPVGEWIGMAADYGVEREGIGLVEVIHFDAEGRYGRSVQARLANRR